SAINQVRSTLPARTKSEVHLGLERGDFLAPRVAVDLLVEDPVVSANNLERGARRFKRDVILRAEALERGSLGDRGKGTAHRMLPVSGHVIGVALGTGIVADVLDFRANVAEWRVVGPPGIVVCSVVGPIALRLGAVARPPPARGADRQANEGHEGAY